MRLERRLVETGDPSVERAEAVDRPGELVGNVGQEMLKVVIQPEAPAGHRNAGAELRTEVEFFAADAELAHQLHQRGTLRALGDPVGERMEADVVLPVAAGVEGIEAARGVVTLEDQHLATEHAEADGGGQAGHAGPDDDRVVVGGDAHRQALMRSSSSAARAICSGVMRPKARAMRAR